MSYLLDTNVISELVQPKPNPAVVGWMQAVAEEDCYLSALTLGEISKGIGRCEGTKRRAQLTRWLEHDLEQRFAGRIVAVDGNVAQQWGLLLAATKRILPAIDSLIAASCLTHRLALVTRNIRDFRDIAGLTVINPWE